ncbi:MAG: hypothetical protein EHM40_03385 [Chloroflexi bacterium]|nr:MAG: hypothetical protein EHM40_03385 [Chloroflexota bacterium]
MDFTLIVAALLSAVVQGVFSGITNGISTRVSNTIASPTRPRRKKKKSTFKKIVIFVFLTAVIYLVIKAWPMITALL